MYQPSNEESLLIERTNWNGTVELKLLAQQFNQAIKAHRLVQFSYGDRNGKATFRQIEPYRLIYKSNHWYVQGYSLERQAFRTFRLSRIKKVDFLKQMFEPRDVTMAAMDPNFNADVTEIEVLITADNVVRDVIVERFGNQVIQSEDADELTAKLRLTDQPGAYRFLLSLGQHVKITSPAKFKQKFLAYIHQIEANYL